MKRFDGWEPVTAYEYDDAGRLARSVPEVEWDDQEQAHMLALAAFRSAQCPGCGGHLPDTTPKELDGQFRASPVQCHACAAREMGAEAYREHPQPGSILFRVERR